MTPDEIRTQVEEALPEGVRILDIQIEDSQITVHVTRDPEVSMRPSIARSIVPLLLAGTSVTPGPAVQAPPQPSVNEPLRLDGLSYKAPPHRKFSWSRGTKKYSSDTPAMRKQRKKDRKRARRGW